MAKLETLPPVADRARRKIARRILPFVFVLYIISYLDRANVAFAKLSMTAELGFSEAVFGFGAGIFFIGYLFLEIPGALIVERWSARKWIARILVSWGICSSLMGLIRTPTHFYAARFVLGLAEAGFFPGIIVYLTHWFTGRDRARAMASFIVGVPVSLVLGAPISSIFLRLHWAGVSGWRWVFILEGAPAVVFGVITWFYLTDYPRDAAWLDPDEREWITRELQCENGRKRAHNNFSPWQGLRQRNVIFLALALCLANVEGYAFVFWLPTTIHRVSGLSASASTAWSALPFIVGLIAMIASGRRSDRAGERKFHAAIPLMLAAVFFALSAVPGQTFPMVLTWLCLTTAAGYSFSAPFWVLPTMTLGESAAAASIGLINLVGNLGGFIGPSIVGFVLTRTHSYPLGMMILAMSAMLGAFVLLAVRVPSEPRVATYSISCGDPT
jgi:ACS family tartrate transporter-like MFS transporter